MRGRFIAFEGGDGSGKTTHARRVAAHRNAMFTREPGGTAVSESLRELLLDPDVAVSPRAEALLMAASRAQLVAEVIAPALERGIDVVTDRFLASSLAYQGYGTGLPVDEVRSLSVFATAGLLPELNVLIDVPVDQSLARLAGRPDRFEGEDRAFHERVREGYLQLAAAEPDRWVVIDGRGSLEEVGALVDEALAQRLSPAADTMGS